MKKWFLGFVTIVVLAVGVIVYQIDRQDQAQVKMAVTQFMNMRDVFEDIKSRKEVQVAATTDQVYEKVNRYVSSHLLTEYRKIVTGKILKDYEDTFKVYSFFSDDYPMFFVDLTDVRIQKINMTRSGLDKYRCLVARLGNEDYSTTIFCPDLNSIVKNYKVTNYTQEQVNKEANRCELVKLEVEQNNTFYLVKKANRWLIYDVKYQILRSKLKLDEAKGEDPIDAL